MEAALTPERALLHLGELSTDIRAAVVLDGAGAWVAGDAALAAGARGLLAGGESFVEVLSPRGHVFAARGPAHSLALVTGRHALPALVRYDIRRALADLVPPS